MEHSAAPSRRAFLRACLALPATWVLAACSTAAGSTPTAAPATQPPAATAATAAPAAQALAPTAAPAQMPAPTAAPAAQAPAPTAAPVLAPTPACGDDDDEPTIAQTEGPFYTPRTPERGSLLEPGIAGTPLVVTGQVLSTGCQPVARALLDFWQADDQGVYDNAGFRLRGHQFTDEQGRYRLETIMPGLYPGRTRHIHVKVQAPNRPVLTTQIYFPGEPANASDGIYDPALEVQLADGADGKAAGFNFVLDVG